MYCTEYIYSVTNIDRQVQCLHLYKTFSRKTWHVNIIIAFIAAVIISWYLITPIGTILHIYIPYVIIAVQKHFLMQLSEYIETKLEDNINIF